MIRHFREIVFHCYHEDGMKFQNFIHCVSLTFRISKGLAKEIIYEMFERKLLDVKLIELTDFGCEGCSTDLAKFSKKSCRPRECLVIVKIRDTALVEAVMDEIKECLESQPSHVEDCLMRPARLLPKTANTAKAIVTAIMKLNYEDLLKSINENNKAIAEAVDNAKKKIDEIQENMIRERKEPDIDEILAKINELETDSPTLIIPILSPQEYAIFETMKSKGDIYFDYTERKWKKAK